MLPILIINVALIVSIFILLRKKFSNDQSESLIKHIGLLEAAWTSFLFILAIFILFDILEIKHDNETFLTAAAPERIKLLSVCAGFGITHLSVLMFIAKKLLKKHLVR